MINQFLLHCVLWGWWSISIVNLMSSIISCLTGHWAGPWDNLLTVNSNIPWAQILDSIGSSQVSTSLTSTSLCFLAVDAVWPGASHSWCVDCLVMVDHSLSLSDKINHFDGTMVRFSRVADMAAFSFWFKELKRQEKPGSHILPSFTGSRSRGLCTHCRTHRDGLLRWKRDPELESRFV